MPRVLLLLPTATYRAPDFVAAAEALGVEVVVGSEHRQAMSRSMEDRALVVPLADPPAAVEAIVALHRRSPVAAVVAVDDQGVLVAAMASAALGLRANPPAAVAATRDKAAMRGALARGGVPQPDHRVVGPGDDVGAAAAAVGLPCVVKPVSLSGSSGVIRADSPAEASAVAARIRGILAARGADEHGPLLVERFVAGDEVAVEALLRDGRLEVLATFDKPDPLDGPYFEETLYVTPSRLPDAALAAVHAAVSDAARALGLVEGPVHAEVRVDRGTAAVAVLELAARSIGGLCSRALRFGAGISLEEVLLRHALGLPAPLDREAAAAGVMMLPIPRTGVLDGVDGIEEALAVPGVVGVEITVTRGKPVRALPEGDRYLGFAFARGGSPDEVEAALRAAHDALVVRITEDDAGCSSVG
ncbi:MAG TPA: ATP-grasp domain-containing protein [Acidimicrobiales bacterium]|nr:ATP-grasp domain-containing protein [Acidimicrobiales bacterium]